jgi:hypothetical protein
MNQKMKTINYKGYFIKGHNNLTFSRTYRLHSAKRAIFRSMAQCLGVS